MDAKLSLEERASDLPEGESVAPAKNIQDLWQAEFTFKEKPVYDFFKRIFDIVFSLLAIIVLAIPMLILMLIVFLYDKHNPIFVQERGGKDGKIIKVIKLRTMYVDAEKKRDEVRKMNNDGQTLMHKTEDDPRIIPFCRFLRRISADEIFQFFNTLRGDMSIIGPRPLPLAEHEAVSKYLKRDVVKPGISCHSVLSEHSRDSYDNWVYLDLKYIRERSFFVDLKIIIKTIGVVLLHKNY